jgi:hypothetical protein
MTPSNDVAVPVAGVMKPVRAGGLIRRQVLRQRPDLRRINVERPKPEIDCQRHPGHVPNFVMSHNKHNCTKPSRRADDSGRLALTNTFGTILFAQNVPGSATTRG